LDRNPDAQAFWNHPKLTMPPTRSRLFLYLLLSGLSGLFILIFINPPTTNAQQPNQYVLIPSGESGPATYQGIIDSARDNLIQGYLRILLLPIGEASNPNEIDLLERTEIIQHLERQRLQIEDLCVKTMPAGIPCEIELAPIITRQDASSSIVDRFFEKPHSAVLITGDDPLIALNVLGGTRLERDLFEAYQKGEIIAGEGGATNILSTAALIGYNEDFGPYDGFNFGSVDVWHTAEQHGLTFGIKQAIIDHAVLQQNHLTRLLNAVLTADTPNLGIGIEDNSGVNIVSDTILTMPFGASTVTIIDAETYQATENITYEDCGSASVCYPQFSARNILLHQLAPGPYGYDLEARRHSLADPDSFMKRDFSSLSIPKNSGAVYISGAADIHLAADSVSSELKASLTNVEGEILVLLVDYQDNINTTTIERLYSNYFQRPVRIIKLPVQGSDFELLELDNIAAMVLLARPGSTIPAGAFHQINNSWQQGTPLLINSAAAQLLGTSYTPLRQNLPNTSSINIDRIPTKAGASMFDFSLTSSLLIGNRWQSMLSTAFQHPENLSIGLTADSGLILSPDGGIAAGTGPLVVLDYRRSILEQSADGNGAIANGLLDIFLPGERVVPVIANARALKSPPPTPEIRTPTATLPPTLTPTATATATQTPPFTPKPTRTRKPSATPLTVPPSANPITINWMVAIGILIIVIILFGLLWNRRIL